MEDAVAFRNYSDDAFLCGIFDGQGGPICALDAADALADEVSAILDSSDRPTTFCGRFSTVNAKLRSLAVPDGCTAAAALVVRSACFIAGVGDSRVVRVLRPGVERSTIDSKLLDRLEFERLRQKGVTPTAEGRVDRKLAVARSLGDFYIRGATLFEPPDIVQFEVSADDVGLVIACDGLWDVLGDAAAGQVVREAETATDAAVALRNCALGTKDNVSVIDTADSQSGTPSRPCPRCLTKTIARVQRRQTPGRPR
jgi:serine/threonine protein phosphatase PrpC